MVERRPRYVTRPSQPEVRLRPRQVRRVGKSLIQDSRPLKKFKVNRNRDGAVLVTAAVDAADKSFRAGDHLLGLKSDEDVLVQNQDAMVHHQMLSSYFNVLDAHIDGQINDKEFAIECANFMFMMLLNFEAGWEVYAKAGDLPLRTLKERRKYAHARRLHKRIAKGDLYS